MDELKIAEKQELAWNGRSVKATEEQIVEIIGPMFALFGGSKSSKEMVAAYVKMLRDVDPDKLADAVLGAMNSCKFLPTVADIREQLESRSPGPRSDVDPHTLPNIPTKMYRADPEEDYRQRMAQLRRTKNWRYDQ
jgi:hypothetical protein